MADALVTAEFGLGIGAAVFDVAGVPPAAAALSKGIALGASFYIAEIFAVASAGFALSARQEVPGGDLANGRYRR